MPSIEELYKYAETAQSAYATGLVAGQNNSVIFQDVGGASFATRQADNFDDRWLVIQQSSTNVSNGFSAVLLQDRVTGEKVLAIAGTDPSSPADILTDIVNIAEFGTALGMPQYASLEAFYAQLVSSGKLSTNEQFVVTGHSLGGFLTQAFTARHVDVVSAAYTYNAPGFGSVESLLGFLGITNPNAAAAKITNVHATDGISMTAGLGTLIGSSQAIRIEASGSPAGNHSVVRLGDSLAVEETLSRLDPTLSRQGANSLVQSASNRNQDTLETLTDSLRRLFMGPAVGHTSLEDRNGLFTNRDALITSSAFQSNAGKVRVNSSAGVDLTAKSRGEFSSFASLLTLSSIVVCGSDAANTSLLDTTLQGAWGIVYGDWQADNLAIAAGRAASNYTNTYLQDREAMLQWVMVQNINDDDSGVIIKNQPIATTFTDIASGRKAVLGAVIPSLSVQVLFGDDACNDNLIGYGKGDRLYGGGGNDTLSGQGGNDWLEGNAGDDVLDGGEGKDTLLGGAGNDTYVFATDWGSDTVRDSDGSGSIQVIGLGIPIDGSNARKMADGSWQTLDKKITYTLVQATDLRSDMIVSFSDRTDVIRIQDWSAQKKVGITLAEAVVAPTVSTTLTGDIVKQVVNGGAYLLSPTGYASSGVQANAADVLNGTIAGEALKGLGGNDGLSGGAGDDFLEGGDGDDLLLGGTGADTINGGNGNDFIFGSAMGLVDTPTAINFTPPAVAAGDVEAARGFSWVASRAAGARWNGSTATFLGIAISGADAAPGFYGPDGLEYTENSGNVIDAGAGNDFVGAGMGADVVHGGDGDDDIYGMGGADVLYGDAGSDFIMGDGLALSGINVTTPSELHGDDILVGGAGNDVLVGQGGNDELYGGDDDDQLFGDAASAGDMPFSVHGNNDTLIGGDGNDSLWGDNGTSTSLPAAFEGADYLDGEDGNDQLVGGGNDDELFGGAGNDLLWGDSGTIFVDGSLVHTAVSSEGRDFLDGEDGNDQLVGGGNDDTLFGGAGNDQLVGDDNVSALPLSANGNDYLDGEEGDDNLLGMGGNDTLIGGSGSDSLQGGDGNDALDGGDDNDALSGGAGDDTLDGGAGSDHLTGGGGRDTYVFGEGSGHDLVDLQGDSSHYYVRLKAGTTVAEIGYARSRDDLFLVVQGTNDILQISNFFAGPNAIPFLQHVPRCDTRDDFIKFEDGEQLDFEQLSARASTTTLDDDFS